MKGLWCVIGKACLDETFALDLTGIVAGTFFDAREDGEKRTIDENMSDFLFFEHGFMLSRWERGEVARLISEWGNRLADIRVLTGEKRTPDNASENFYAFVGLTCIDGQMGKKIKTYKTQRFSRDLSVAMSRFRLVDREISYLRWFYGQDEVFERLQAAHDDFWTRPTEGKPTSCVWSFTHDAKYKHLPPKQLNKLLKTAEPPVSATDQPNADEPKIEQPIAAQPVAAQPVAAQPAVAEPSMT